MKRIKKKKRPEWQPFDDPTMLRIETLEGREFNSMLISCFESLGNIKSCKLHNHFIVGLN